MSKKKLAYIFFNKVLFSKKFDETNVDAYYYFIMNKIKRMADGALGILAEGQENQATVRSYLFPQTDVDTLAAHRYRNDRFRFDSARYR